MRTLLVLMAAVIGGMAAHLTRPVIDRCFENEVYRRMSSYSVGVLVMQPFSILLSNQLRGVSDEDERHMLSNLMTAALFAIGVMFGYFLDLVSQREV